jgi:hypothetical protein
LEGKGSATVVVEVSETQSFYDNLFLSPGSSGGGVASVA